MSSTNNHENERRLAQALRLSQRIDRRQDARSQARVIQQQDAQRHAIVGAPAGFLSRVAGSVGAIFGVQPAVPPDILAPVPPAVEVVAQPLPAPAPPVAHPQGPTIDPSQRNHAPTLAQGAPFPYQRCDEDTYRDLLSNRQVQHITMPVPQDHASHERRTRLMENIVATGHLRQQDCRYAPDIARALLEGPKKEREIMAALDLTHSGPHFIASAINMMKEFGIIVHFPEGNVFMLTAFFWFGQDPPYKADDLVCPSMAEGVPFQWQRLDSDTYNGMVKRMEVRDVKMPVPQDDESHDHQFRMVERICVMGTEFKKAHEIVSCLKARPKTEAELMDLLGYNNPGVHYMSKPISQLRAAGIIVKHPATKEHKLTPFFWFAP